MASLLGYASMRDLLGTEIEQLIPSLKLEESAENVEQHVCAIGVKGNSIPITATVSAERDQNHQPVMFDVNIRALSAVNGIVTMTDTGLLYSFNENFLQALTGRDPTESRKMSLQITDMIPSFFEYLHESGDDIDNADIVRSSSDGDIKKCIAPADLPAKFSKISLDTIESDNSSKCSDEEDCAQGPSTSALLSISLDTIESDNSSKCSDEEDCAQGPSTSALLSVDSEPMEPGLLSENEIAQFLGENLRKDSKRGGIKEGIFYGCAKHNDENLIPVRFEVRRIEAKGSPALWSVTINYDRTTDFGLFDPKPTVDESAETILVHNGNPTDVVHLPSNNHHDRSLPDPSEDTIEPILTVADSNIESIRGEYSKYYDTFQVIGNGAFGSVRLSANKETGLLSITKLICKAKVLPDGWTRSRKRGDRMIPIEVHLLETLQHPNIVKCLDVFENETHYQLVIEKLGIGMDLFEFIDYQPKMDEQLLSYIFRQIVSALHYLHSNHIVHRDLKDENVIIDQNFNIKLIDFGSAAPFGEDLRFSTFCGTMEYCSPEVLIGNRYRGPELEMWSLGVLLYTLVFYNNPFLTVTDTVRAEVDLPMNIPEGLYQVLSWLLQRDPKSRATVDDIRNHWWTQQKVDITRYSFREVMRYCGRNSQGSVSGNRVRNPVTSSARAPNVRAGAAH
uniref:Protein kinase domain-containing protein n=1 Tax=Steinernema glaseri TaxID=37863 RepID=A0A1I7ZVL4_9BILA